jgi:hypothetical protein
MALGPLSLSGVELDGDSLVRRIYCDESGTSGQGILVVAGVIVHGQTQWKPLEQHIGELINMHIDEEDRSGFVFHATQLFSASGKVFKNRDRYPLARRLEALKAILAIPSRFKLPVVVGFTRREKSVPGETTQARRESITTDQALALCKVVVAAEKFMRRYTDPDELAEMIVEDNTHTRQGVDRMQNVLRGIYSRPNPDLETFLRITAFNLHLSTDFLPITKISESISWKDKRGARLLQVADACAFIVRQYLEERSDIEDLISAFVPSGAQRIADLALVRASEAGMLEIKCWD